MKDFARGTVAGLVLSLAGSAVVAAGPPASPLRKEARDAAPPSISDRIEGERAVERARYAFVIGATKPFDTVYPRSVFEGRVEHEIGEEHVLKNVFHLAVTPDLLAREFDRIETNTRAPEQWEAIKKALANDRRRIEEIFCRPLLIDRVLRTRFAFDSGIHAVAHRKARAARAALLAGKTVSGGRVVLARRKSEPAATTDELLGKAMAEASSGRVLSSPRVAQDTPLSLDPEVTVVLERELKLPGDVTTILEERDGFEVFRLIAVTEDSWKLEAVRFAKVDFDSWLAGQRRRLSRPIR